MLATNLKTCGMFSRILFGRTTKATHADLTKLNLFFCREHDEQEHVAEQQAPLLAEDANHPPQADLSHLSPVNPSRSASLEMTEGRRSYTNDLCDAAGETSGPRSGSVSCLASVMYLFCLLWLVQVKSGRLRQSLRQMSSMQARLFDCLPENSSGALSPCRNKTPCMCIPRRIKEEF